jgi:hypothetical protein
MRALAVAAVLLLGCSTAGRAAPTGGHGVSCVPVLPGPHSAPSRCSETMVGGPGGIDLSELADVRMTAGCEEGASTCEVSPLRGPAAHLLNV